jgi:hypothetical protein
VTEVGLSGPTKLFISRENELSLRGSPRGGPSEGRAGNQRDQCESSDKCLHHISPFSCNKEDRRFVPCIPQGNSSAARSDQLYLWIYWISQRSKALYFGLLSSRHSLSFDLGSAWPSAMPCKTAVARTPLGSKFLAKVGMCLVTDIFQVTMVQVGAGGLP